jgi:aminoglycoside phosphotransferase (APT) family kinase protein
VTDAASPSGRPRPPTEQSVVEVTQQLLGTRVTFRRWYVHTDTYAVASVVTNDRFVIKLEVPGSRRNRRFEVMPTLAHMARTQTTVPVADVVAVDTSRRKWPWNVLIATELPGQTWAELYPRLDNVQRAAAQRRLGEAAAQLHTVAFDGCGEVGANGLVAEPRRPLAALAERARCRLRTPGYRDYFRQVLDAHADLLSAAPGPRLCHEDLNPYNLLFELHDGQPVLTGVLDFEIAWAGLPESDLARLELWRWTRGAALRDGYVAAGSISDSYLWRRPIFQLLWCLEYAEYRVSVQHQLETNAVCDELGLAPIRLVPALG